MSLLSQFCSDHEDEVMEGLAAQAKNGITPRIRSDAVLHLGLFLDPKASETVRELLPDLDEDTRAGAETMLRTLDGRLARAAGSRGHRGDELHRWQRKRLLKDGQKAHRRIVKLVRSMLADEFERRALASEPVVAPDLAVGGPGYRADFIPANPEAARISAWIGAQGVRCAIGNLGACFTKKANSRFTARFWGLGIRSYAQKAVNGEVCERVAPDGKASILTVPLAFNEVEVFKTSSTAPDLPSIPNDWLAVRYEPYGEDR